LGENEEDSGLILEHRTTSTSLYKLYLT